MKRQTLVMALGLVVSQSPVLGGFFDFFSTPTATLNNKVNVYYDQPIVDASRKMETPVFFYKDPYLVDLHSTDFRLPHQVVPKNEELMKEYNKFQLDPRDLGISYNDHYSESDPQMFPDFVDRVCLSLGGMPYSESGVRIDPQYHQTLSDKECRAQKLDSGCYKIRSAKEAWAGVYNVVMQEPAYDENPNLVHRYKPELIDKLTMAQRAKFLELVSPTKWDSYPLFRLSLDPYRNPKDPFDVRNARRSKSEGGTGFRGIGCFSPKGERIFYAFIEGGGYYDDPLPDKLGTYTFATGYYDYKTQGRPTIMKYTREPTFKIITYPVDELLDVNASDRALVERHKKRTLQAERKALEAPTFVGSKTKSSMKPLGADFQARLTPSSKQILPMVIQQCNQYGSSAIEREGEKITCRKDESRGVCELDLNVTFPNSEKIHDTMGCL